MSFADAFLRGKKEYSVEDNVAFNAEKLIQSISPEPKVSNELTNVNSSNLRFGIPMNWAMNDSDRHAHVCKALKYRLALFEPRLKIVNDVSIEEEINVNCFQFVISGTIIMGKDIEIAKRVSFFDHQIVKVNA